MKGLHPLPQGLVRMQGCSLNAFSTICKLVKSSVLVTLLIISAVTSVAAQQQAFQSPAGTNYLLYTPPGYNTSTQSFPLLISLHGKGEVGTDITKLSSKNPQQMPSRLIYLNKWPQDLPFIVLTPQQKPTLEDPDPEWEAQYIDEVLQFVMQNYRIDATRIYLTGLSLGGTGCWTYAAAFPEKVAAVVTLCGRSDPKKACLVKNIPIWNFHGDGDTVVPPYYSASMINAINLCTPAGVYTPRLTILNAKAHDGWNEIYNGTNGYRIYEWLLKFKKGDLSNKSPYVSAGPDRKVEVQNSPLTLDGDFFDTDGTITNVQWTAVSGPSVTMNNATEKSLILSDLKAGICVFELAVTDDDGSVSRDQVTIEIVGSASTLKVTGLFLVNGATNTDISPLTEGMTINKYTQKLSEINIRATTTSDVLSTRFSISTDGNTRTLNSTTPLYIKPQTTGPEWKIANGEYVICATPFSKTNGTGVQGVSKCIKINVVDGQECEGKGKITREVWNNITGTNISSIPVSTTPSSAGQLSLFESPANIADNYGAKVSGYVCPPASGNYVFYISSDANSELWLSTDDNPANKVKIAFVTGTTSKLQWDKYTSQKSIPITLSGDKRYYIEALHKESTGSDHLAVGWQLPNQVLERPIPGNRLIPFRSVANVPPLVSITTPVNNQTFSDPSTLRIAVKTSDQDGQVFYVDFFRNGVKMGRDYISPFEFIWYNPAEGASALTARAFDNEGASTLSAPVNINVLRNASTGTIRAEYWTGISGIDIAIIPINTAPTSTSVLSMFESPSNIGDNYGTRIRGYVSASQSGEYVFWIASNDRSELWLSTDELPLNRTKIANVSGYTSSREWTKYASQQSLPVTLVSGRKYYIEALHKEGTGADHVAVGWKMPDGVLERPIPGSRLSPFETTGSLTSGDVQILTDDRYYAELTIYPNPTTGEMVHAEFSGDQTDGEIEFKLMTIPGSEILSKRITCAPCNSFDIEFKNRLSAGLYLLTVTKNGKTYRRRMLVE